jgi:hypothetical protein
MSERYINKVKENIKTTQALFHVLAMRNMADLQKLAKCFDIPCDLKFKNYKYLLLSAKHRSAFYNVYNNFIKEAFCYRYIAHQGYAEVLNYLT